MDNDIKKKMWIIQRIEQMLEIQIKFKDNSKLEFQNFIDNEIEKYNQIEKTIVKVGVFFVTLVLGLTSVGALEVNNVIGSLFFIFIIGIGIYVPTSMFKSAIKKILDSILISLSSGMALIYRPTGYLNRKGFEIESHSVEDYKQFGDYITEIIVPCLYINGYFRLRKYKKSFILSTPIIKHLNELSVRYKKWIDEGVEKLEKNRIGYQSNELIKPMNEFNDMLEDYISRDSPNIKSDSKSS